jgi:hypothetical protein
LTVSVLQCGTTATRVTAGRGGKCGSRGLSAARRNENGTRIPGIVPILSLPSSPTAAHKHKQHFCNVFIKHTLGLLAPWVMGVLGWPSGSIISLLKYFSVLDFRTNCKGEKKGKSGRVVCRLEWWCVCVWDDDSWWWREWDSVGGPSLRETENRCKI